MRAISQTETGAPSVLKIVELPDPTPMMSDVVVRVKAIGLNPVDAVVRSGSYKMLGEPPFVLGWDLSGVIESVVPGVHRFRVGDEVFGMPFFPRAANAYAELVAVPSRQLARKPTRLSHEQAAGLGLAGLTAWQSLVEVAQVQRGQRVLIQAGGGGVGHLAIQIAKCRGAYVVATASAAKHEFVRSLGADEAIDYKTTKLADAVSDIDVALDSIGKDSARQALETLRPRGKLITLVNRDDQALNDETRQRGFTFIGFSVEPDHVGLEHLAALATEQKLTVHVGHTFRFEDVVAAHELLDQGSALGKIVLTI